MLSHGNRNLQFLSVSIDVLPNQLKYSCFSFQWLKNGFNGHSNRRSSLFFCFEYLKYLFFKPPLFSGTTDNTIIVFLAFSILLVL